jgi:hypothetical protein
MKTLFDQKHYLKTAQIYTYQEYLKDAPRQKLYKTIFNCEKELQKAIKIANKELRISEKQHRTEIETQKLNEYNQGLIKRKPTKERAFIPYIHLEGWDQNTKEAFYEIKIARTSNTF